MEQNAIPKDLAALSNWVCWRMERDKRTKRDAKVPYCPATGKRASASDPATWSTLKEALLNKDKCLFSGIGFVFTAESSIVGERSRGNLYSRTCRRNNGTKRLSHSAHDNPKKGGVASCGMKNMKNYLLMKRASFGA